MPWSHLRIVTWDPLPHLSKKDGEEGFSGLFPMPPETLDEIISFSRCPRTSPWLTCFLTAGSSAAPTMRRNEKKWAASRERLTNVPYAPARSWQGRNAPFHGREGRAEGDTAGLDPDWAEEPKSRDLNCLTCPHRQARKEKRRRSFSSDKERFWSCLWFSQAVFLWSVIGIPLSPALEAGVKFKMSINCIQTSRLLCDWTEGIKNENMGQLGNKLGYFLCTVFVS